MTDVDGVVTPTVADLRAMAAALDGMTAPDLDAPSFRAAVVVLGAAFVGADAVAAHIDEDPAFVAACIDCLRAADLWIDGVGPDTASWEDPEGGVVAFWLSALVASGDVVRVGDWWVAASALRVPARRRSFRLPDDLAAAEADWHDRTLTTSDVTARHGASAGTLRRLFGKRRVPRGRKPCILRG